MGLLGVLGFDFVIARRFGNVVRPVQGGDDHARLGEGLRSRLHAIGAHIGDEPHGLAADIHALIKLLRRLHGPLC